MLTTPHAYHASCLLTIKLTHTACLPLSSSCFMLATFILLSCYHNHTCTHAVDILMIIPLYLHSCYYVTHAYYYLSLTLTLICHSRLLLRHSCLLSHSRLTHAYPRCSCLLIMPHVTHAAIMLIMLPYATQTAILR